MADKKEEVKKEEPKTQLDPIVEATALAAKILGETLAAKQPGPRKFRTVTTGQCSECGQPQYVTEAGLGYACEGSHSQMVVWPQEDKYWPGICLNGVWYKSNGPGHLVTVPKNNNFQQHLELWDRQEREYRTGREVRPSSYNVLKRPPVATGVG